MLKIFNDKNVIKQINNDNNFVFAFSTTEASAILKQIIDLNIKDKKKDKKNLNIILLTKKTRKEYFNKIKRYIYTRDFNEVKLKNNKKVLELDEVFSNINFNKNIYIKDFFYLYETINKKKILQLVKYLKEILPEHKIFIIVFSESTVELNNDTIKIIKELNKNQIFFNFIVNELLLMNYHH